MRGFELLVELVARARSTDTIRSRALHHRESVAILLVGLKVEAVVRLKAAELEGLFTSLRVAVLLIGLGSLATGRRGFVLLAAEFLLGDAFRPRLRGEGKLSVGEAPSNAARSLVVCLLGFSQLVVLLLA